MQSINFISYHHSDAIKAEIEQLQRIGFFPSTEVEMELDQALKHALVGSYKAAFADLRRALELTLTTVYLVSEHVNKQKAVDWVKSNMDTPFVSTMLSKLIKLGRYKDFNDNYDWKNNFNQVYWSISDFAHTKGQLKGYRKLNNIPLTVSHSSVLNINTQTLSSFLDSYIKVIGEIVTILILYNPVILVGLPIDEKFALNPPASGFYYDHQAELISQLIPAAYKTFFENLVKSDQEIKNTVEWVMSLPDLTDDDVYE